MHCYSDWRLEKITIKADKTDQDSMRSYFLPHFFFLRKSIFRKILISANMVYKKKEKETANLGIVQLFYHSPCEHTSALQNKLFVLLKISKASSKSKTALDIKPGFY